MEASARPDVDVYVQELKKKGLGELAEKARLLIGGINVDASALELARQRTQALQSIVPTLDSVDCVCELRAIFRRQPSPNQSEKHFRDFKVLLGFEPVALVNVQLNNAANEDVPCSFQVTERSLKSLIKTLQEAAEQLEIIKRMGVRAPEK